MAKIIKSAKFHITIKAILLAFIFFVFLKVLLLDNIEEIVSCGSEVGDIFYQLALSYIGGYIFYWIANYQGGVIEKERNKIINKIKIEELIYRSEQILFAYISLIGKRQGIKSPSDLTTLNFENSELKISVRTLNNHFVKLEKTDNGYIENKQPYYDLFIEDVSKLNDIMNSCVDNYHLMPLYQVLLLQNYFENYQLNFLLNRIKGLDELYKIKGFPPEGYTFSKDDNDNFCKELNIIKNNLMILKEYFETEFNNEYKNPFQIPSYDPRFDIVGFK